MVRKGNAVWTGGLKDGKGTVSTASGVLKDTQYSFATRFENGVGTNPEELLAAAHAGCFLHGTVGATGERWAYGGTDRNGSSSHAGQSGWWLWDYPGAANGDGEGPRRECGSFPESCRRGQGRLPGFQAVQYQDHDGREAGVVGPAIFLKRLSEESLFCCKSQVSAQRTGREPGASLIWLTTGFLPCHLKVSTLGCPFENRDIRSHSFILVGKWARHTLSGDSARAAPAGTSHSFLREGCGVLRIAPRLPGLRLSAT